MITESKSGLVVFTLASPVHEYPTHVQPLHIVDPLGIAGDSHYGPDRGSFTQPGIRKWNDRPICIVAEEAQGLLNKECSRNLQPGDFNEQLLVRGLGDLAWVAIGSLITFAGSNVSLEVVDRAYPCEKMEAYTGIPLKELTRVLVDKDERAADNKPTSRRGILAKVLHPGIIRPNVGVYINPPFQG